MPRRKQLADDAVLDALLPVVVARGLDRVTLQQLGDVVGLSPAALLQRFGSRTALIEAALDRGTDALEADLAAPLPDADPLPALATWLADLTAPLATRDLLVGSLQILGRDIAVPARNAAARRHLGLIRARIHRGLVAHGVPTNEADRLAPAVEAHWHGLVLQWGLHGEGDLHAWVRAGIEGLLAALLDAPRTGAHR